MRPVDVFLCFGLLNARACQSYGMAWKWTDGMEPQYVCCGRVRKGQP